MNGKKTIFSERMGVLTPTLETKPLTSSVLSINPRKTAHAPKITHKGIAFLEKTGELIIMVGWCFMFMLG